MTTEDMERWVSLLRAGEDNLRAMREAQETLLEMRRAQDEAVRRGQEAIERQVAWMSRLQALMFPATMPRGGDEARPEERPHHVDERYRREEVGTSRPREREAAAEAPKFDLNNIPVEQIKAGMESFSKVLDLLDGFRKPPGQPPRR